MKTLAPELVELESKASLHSLLAQGFNYPDEKLVKGVQSGEFLDCMQESLTVLGHSSLKNVIESCRKECVSKKSSEAEVLLELERDYTRLFFASKPRLAYLFESVYREGKLLQDSTFQIARLYSDAGLKLSEEFRLPPDHIAVELEFLAFLVFKEIEGINNANKEQVEYARELQGLLISEHLRAFARNLAERVAEHARTTFYQTLAQVLKQYYSETPDL
jgi:TorA maturation chaperone TorD